ncbi:MAG: hypothetical protein KAU14_06850, partial [Thermoplasmata archaeon]|nr:hypothetical protein [Thermoplasmata archaeon]
MVGVRTGLRIGVLLVIAAALLLVVVITLIVVPFPHAQADRGSPNVNYDITPSFDISHKLNENDQAIVFYGDSLYLIPKVDDPDGDRIVKYEWTFKVNEAGNNNETSTDNDVVRFTVGVEHLYSEGNESQPVMPEYNSGPTNYTLTLEAWDEYGDGGEHTMDITVYPYAKHVFNTTVTHGTYLLDANVTLIWRGLPEEAAPSASNVSPERPVFVYVSKTTSPDINLANRGGIGNVYDIRAVGCYLQNGDEGFIEAETSLPYLTSDIECFGDASILQEDLRLEFFSGIEKRFIAVEGSHPEFYGNISYVVGTVDHFSIYTIIVDSIYNTANPNFNTILPDLSVSKIEFSKEPVRNRREVVVSAHILNTGVIHARNVEVRFYDGNDIISDQRAEIVRGNGTTMVVNTTFIAYMVYPDSECEDHTIRVFVNKLHAIRETEYKNNTKARHLMIVPNSCLEIESISHFPFVPDEGDTVTITLTLNCTGDREIKNTTITVLVDDTLLDNFILNNIEPGELVNLSFNFTAGKEDHTISINITYLYWEENIQWKIWVTKPELQIESIDLFKLDPDDGDNVTINVTITNTGNASAKNVTVRIFVDDELKDTFNVSVVEPNESVDLSYNWSAEKGNHTITVNMSYQDGSDQMMKEYELKVTVENKDDGDGGGDSDDNFLFEQIGPLPLIGYIGIIAVIAVVGVVAVKKKKEKTKGGMAPSTIPSQQSPSGQSPPQQPLPQPPPSPSTQLPYQQPLPQPPPSPPAQLPYQQPPTSQYAPPA